MFVFIFYWSFTDYNVVLVLGVQESGSVIDILCQILFHCILLRDIEYSPLHLYFSLDLCMNLKLLKEVFFKKSHRLSTIFINYILTFEHLFLSIKSLLIHYFFYHTLGQSQNEMCESALTTVTEINCLYFEMSYRNWVNVEKISQCMQRIILNRVT